MFHCEADVYVGLYTAINSNQPILCVYTCLSIAYAVALALKIPITKPRQGYTWSISFYFLEKWCNETEQNVMYDTRKNTKNTTVQEQKQPAYIPTEGSRRF